MSGAEPCTGSKIPGPSSPRLAEAARPSPPVTARGDVREDVAEHVLGDDDVDALGRGHDLHREAVDERVPHLDVRVLRCDLVDDAAPQPRRVEHVRLVDRDERAAARGGELEAAPHDALDLRRVVLAACRRRCRRRARRARRSRGRRPARARSRGRRRPARPGGGSRRRRAPCAGRAAPASGRTLPPSHFGPPTAPSSTARAERQAASVSAGSGSPNSSIAAPPNGRLTVSTSSGRCSSTRTACSSTSGPDAVTGQAGDHLRHARPRP